MKKIFRYDYNFKLFIITNIISFIFLLIAVVSYNKYIIAFWLLGIMFFISIINTFVFIYNQGIRVKNEKVIIVDFLWVTRFKLNELKYAEIKEIKKDKKDNLYGFMHEFYDPDTYMWKCDYVYNNGRVFNIIFYLKDGSTRKTYFGWMYKEKSSAKVNKIVIKLKNFIEEINQNCKKK